MKADNNKIVVADLSDHELFTPVYHSFLHSKRLNGKEKLLYIVLKSFLNVGSREGEVYPTIETISDMVDMSKPTVINILKSLETKGVLKITQRGLNKPNLYTLYDYKALWQNTENEANSELEKQRKEEDAINFLKSRGYKFVSKEKELESNTGQSTETSTNNQSFPKNNDNIDAKKNQEEIIERYPLAILKESLHYNDMLLTNPMDKDMIDTFFHYLYDTMNTTKNVIRVNGEDKPREVVISVLAKIGYFDFLYAIEKYKTNTSKINNQGAYIITLLYNAKAQNEADITNQVQHDMYG